MDNKNKKDIQIKELTEKCKLLENDVLMAKADLINYRKRKDEETSNYLRYKNENIFLELLPVIDNFERAINLDDNNLTDELSNFLSGFKLIYSSLKDILNNNEVKEINCLHQKFDSRMHQALFTDNDSNFEDEVILEVLQKGYTYKDKVLRPTSVKVNKIENINNLKGDNKNE